MGKKADALRAEKAALEETNRDLIQQISALKAERDHQSSENDSLRAKFVNLIHGQLKTALKSCRATDEEENELEYILPVDLDQSLLDGWERVEIKQAYLEDILIDQFGEDFEDKKLRIRESHYTSGERANQTKHEVGLKTRSEGNTHVQEQEAPIPDNLFTDIFNEVAEDRRLLKIRYQKDFGDEKVCVDFFIDGDFETGAVYFVKADIEMPEGRTEPQHTPDVIRQNTLHAVERADRSFSSRKMSSVEYAQERLKWVLEQPTAA